MREDGGKKMGMNARMRNKKFKSLMVTGALIVGIFSGCSDQGAQDSIYPFEYSMDETFGTLHVESMKDGSTELVVPAEVDGIEVLAVDCYDLGLTSIDLSECANLSNLNCGDNLLEELDLSECTALRRLWCSNNPLTVLDTTPCTMLVELSCAYCSLESLDISSCYLLQDIDCRDNKLESIDLSAQSELETLYCDSNNLTVLGVSKNPELSTLVCDRNNLTRLDVSMCMNLTFLDCGFNMIESLLLPQNGAAFDMLMCNDNTLTALELTGISATDDSVFNCIYNRMNSSYADSIGKQAESAHFTSVFAQPQGYREDKPAENKISDDIDNW